MTAHEASSQQPPGGRPSPGRDVLILGAGFSRAVSDRMPLVDELGNLCLRVNGLASDSRVPLGGFTGGSFERWLSQLADEQPYLTAQENLENQALFLRFSSAIADVLGEKVQETLAGGAPLWLSEFVRTAHIRRATLITFNYDPLIECVVGTGFLQDRGSRKPVFWAEVTGDVPSWPPGAMRLGAEKADTFRMLKLHGSLNWYWSPSDVAGVSIARRVLPGVFGAPDPYTEDERRRELPGRVPFVVPPSAVKSSYYRNPLIREIWQQAAEALRMADRIFLIGYSLPPSDVTFASMLVESLKRSDAPLTIVDLCSSAIIRRLLRLGFYAVPVHALDIKSDSPVADFTAQWCDELGEDTLNQLSASMDETSDDPMLIDWGQDAVARVVEIREVDGLIVLVAESPRPFQAAIASGQDAEDSRLPSLGDALRAVGDRSSVKVVTTDGRRQTIIGWAVQRSKTGYGRGVWNALTPSGPL
jgi:hypothetical protein